jgi:uncharacterized repeat protein (TIGR01451 family)
MNKQPCTNYPKSHVTHRRFLFALARSLLVLATMFIAAEALAAGQIDYIVTAPVNPVKPGELVEFDVTVHNLTGSDQTVNLTATVPPFTRNGGFNPGDHFGVIFGTVSAGASQTRIVRLSVNNGDQAPPDGQQITLTMDDTARGVVGIQRTVTVQSIQALNLRLSTSQASVAPGENFTYTVSVSNVSAGTLSNVNLNVKIPQGASFVSADGATHSGADVNWALNTLPPGANRQLHVTLKCNATESDPLGPVVATVTDAISHTAQASDTRAVDSSPDFEYTITTPIDPPRPGDRAVFYVTVHNRSNSDRSLTLTGTVPLFTDNGGFTPGDGFGIVFGTVSAGTSQTRIVTLTVRTGNVAPPEGAPITLNVVRFDRTASVSRTVIVHSRPALDLQLSTANATVMPGQQFTYTILASNISGTTLSGVNLQVPIPAGATFVSADGGGSSANGVVSWNSIGALAAGAFRQFHVTFQAGNATDSFLLLLEGTLSDSANDAARASDTRVVDAAPAFDYTITSPPSGQRVKPGDVIEFDVTVHNRSNSDRSLTLTGIVPLFTNNGGFTPGDGFGVVFGTVLAGTSQTRIASLTVRNGTLAPPNGATITLNLVDLVRAASVSRSVVVGSVPAAKADFNGDGLPDWVLYNPLTHQLAVWYTRDATFLGGAVIPSLPAGWTLIDADQFGGSGASSDLLLFNSSTGQTAVWYFNGASFVAGALGPRIPGGWTVLLSQDFNSDGEPDLLLYNLSTHQTAIWYLNGVAFAGGAFGPTLPAGWTVAGAADFNGDGNPDLLLWTPSGRSTAIWYLNGTSFLAGAGGPTLPAGGWRPAIIDDVNRDGKPDFVLWNPSTHQTAIWHLNNNTIINGVFGPSTPANWWLFAPK